MSAVAPLRRLYHARESRQSGHRVDELLDHMSDGDRALDAAGVRAAFGLVRAPDRTCFRSVRAVPPGHSLSWRGGWRIESVVGEEPSALPLDQLLGAAIAREVASARRPALALSGGLDSAILLALAREVGASIEVLSLRTGHPGYDESDRALATARHIGVSLHFIDVPLSEFAAALPNVVAGIEQPLWNLHPAGRLLLARAAADRGIDVLVTGDGADQAFTGDDGLDWLPLVGALGAAAGVRMAAPFLDPVVFASLAAAGTDPEKRALRHLANGRVPDSILRAPKRARLAPAIDVSAHLDASVAAALAAELDLPLELASDAGRVRWTSLCLLHRSHVLAAPKGRD